MDDLQIIEVIDTVRERLRADIPDLDVQLDRTILADYRTADSGLLQEVLIQVVHGLDPQIPDDARRMLRLIAEAEATAPVPVAPGSGRTTRGGSWSVRENLGARGNPSQDPPLDPKVAQGLRYLTLPGVADNNDEPTSRGTLNAVVVPVHSGAVIHNINEPPAADAVPIRDIPTRLGQQLARCSGVAQAVSLVRKRIPALRAMPAHQFLAAIGYPAALPSADALRFSRYTGLIPSDDDGAAADAYHVVLQRASRVTGVPMAHISHLVALYSGAHKVKDYTPVCGRRPRCGVCPLAGRCSHFASQSEAVVAGNGGAVLPDRGKTIKDWAVDERPRERLLAGERLSNSELLAIILRTGSGRHSAVELGREVMNTFSTLHDLEKASPQDIVSRMRGKGIGSAKAAEICAAIELGRRVATPAADTRLGLRQVTSSRDIFELCRPRYKAATQEEFLLLILNTKNRVQKEVSVSLGTLNSSIVHPRDVFRHALREAAAAVIFVHNHPSGDPAPSDEDILLTARLVDIGKLLGIQVLDHVIVGSHEYYSFADHGRLR